MTAKEVVRKLKAAGFEEVSQSGSHLKLRKGERTTIVPIHRGDIKIGTLRQIEKQTGVVLR